MDYISEAFGDFFEAGFFLIKFLFLLVVIGIPLSIITGVWIGHYFF